MTVPPDPEVLLDDADALVGRDGDGLLWSTAQAGALVRRTIPSDPVAVGSVPDRVRSVVLCGHGEAASAARCLRALALDTVPAPVVVHDAPGPPDWLTVGDCVLALSRTGDDEHSLRAAELALRRGGSLFAIAPEGSPLGVLASGTTATWWPIPPDVLDGTALWAQVAFGLEVFAGLQRIEPHEARARSSLLADRLDETSARNGPVVATYQNAAKTLALELLSATPLLAADSALAAAAADRFAARLLHCTGVPSQVVRLPGGLASVASAVRGPLARRTTADIFYDPYDTDAGAGAQRPLRIVLFAESLDPGARHHLQQLGDQHGVAVSMVAADGDEPVHRLATMIQPSDLAVVYLSLLAAGGPSQPAYP